MAGPTLTPEEIAQLQAERAKQVNIRDAMLAAVPQKAARTAELAVADGSFKKFFDYYNDDIIGPYDAERKALDGNYIASPVVEADITNPASLIASRTTPSLPDTDIIRIAEFDGGPLVVDADNESQHISDQADAEDALVNGFAGTSPTVTATSLTNSAFGPTDTTLDVEDATGPMSFAVGDVFVIHDGGTNAAILKVTNVTDNAGGDPPYDLTLEVEVLVAPAGTIAIGSDIIDSFTGFNNTERTNKVASLSELQPVMDALISNLEGLINNRILRLDDQLTALAAQQDPDATAEIATAQTDVNTSKTFINNYLLTTDISDTGISSLSTERGTRSSQVSTRIAQIINNYTGQTENYYDKRYQFANDRGNTSRGTLRIQKNSEQGGEQAQNLADAAQAQIDSIDGILSI